MLVLVAAGIGSAQDDTASPRIIDNADFDDFRRIWGAPDGAFYLMERGGCEIRTYPDGKTRSIRLRGSRKLVSSEKGRYYGIIRYNSFSPSALSIRQITIYDKNGSKKYTISDPDCTAFLISDNGPTVVAISGVEGLGETRLKFYNENGKLVGSTEVEDFSNPAFSVDGRYLYAQSTDGMLVRFSSSGRRLKEFTHCRKYFLTNDGETVATYADSILTIFTDTDSPVGLSVPDPDLREVSFSRDGSRLAMLSSRRLEIFDLAQRDLIGEYVIEDTTYQLLHMAANDDLSLIVCSASNAGASPEVRHRTGKVVLFDGTAAKLWEEKLSYLQWTIRYPEVRINPAGTLFSALSAKELKIYEVR